MLKKSVLTPVLSGVLAVTVAGSGVAYYNTFVKDGGKDGKSSGSDERTVKSMLTIDEAAKVVETRLDKAQDVAKGNLDNGCKATITYKAPTGGSIGEMGLKDITLGVEAKQKDKMSGMDYVVGYDGKNFLTMNIVYDNDSETAYVKIPELSDAYLVGTSEEIQGMSQGGMTGMTGGIIGQADTSAFEDYDFEALIDDLTGYIDTIKENAPKAKDGDKYTVEKDGVKIDLDTKTYHITAEDAQKVAKAVADKGRQDATLKDFFVKAGAGEDEYNEIWSGLDEIDEGDTDTLDIDVYYLDGNAVGFNAKGSEGETWKMVNAADDTHLIVDYDFNADGDNFKMNGLLSYENDVLNGTLTANTSGSSTDNFTVTFDNLTVTDDTSKGTLSFNGTVEGETMNFSITFDCQGSNGTVTMTGSANGEDFGTLVITSEETNASDITVPSGTSYKLSDENDLQKYLESCDVEGFTNSLKDVLGEDLYNQLGLGGAQGGGAAYGGGESSDSFSLEDLDPDDFQIETIA